MRLASTEDSLHKHALKALNKGFRNFNKSNIDEHKYSDLLYLFSIQIVLVFMSELDNFVVFDHLALLIIPSGSLLELLLLSLSMLCLASDLEIKALNLNLNLKPNLPSLSMLSTRSLSMLCLAASTRGTHSRGGGLVT